MKAVFRVHVACLLMGAFSGAAEPPQPFTNDASFTNRGIMMYGDRSPNGHCKTKDPSVVRFKGQYFLYYSVPMGEGLGGWRVAIATSADLLTWRKVLTMEPEHPSEANGFCAPGAIVLGNRVHLFYQTYGNREKDAICHAWSDDGVHFTREPSNPIFHPQGDWTCGRAIDAEVIAYGDRLLMYFASRDPSYDVQLLGAASAPLNSDFSRSQWTQMADDSILKPELAWEKKCIEAPTVVQRGDALVMFYAGAFNNQPQQIGSAISHDGIHWERLADEPFLPVGKAGDWNSSESGHPGFFKDDDGKSYLFYQGNQDGGKSWYLSKVEIGWNGNKPLVMPRTNTNAIDVPKAKP
ncbi:MAG: family 43 glycosylhydrolase [Akkermansiaceae bacterium]|nr:family 43 glycosylhydrolase [Akkermansiaceae bacterium]